MNVLIDIIHPAHVHFFRNAIKELENRGHNVAITARARKDVTIELLQAFEIPFNVISSAGTGRAGLLAELVVRDIRLLRFCLRFKPDVLTGISGTCAAHVGTFLRKPSVVWDDTEHQKLAHRITYPCATAVYSPDCYMKPMGPKHHFYSGLHELAYLHPRRFTPNPDLVRALGIDEDSEYCVIRMVSFGAHHDTGQHGLVEQDKIGFIERIAAKARVYITSESPLPRELEKYRLTVPVHFMHHVLAFASLCVAEGATVASEAALLGVPTVYINTLKLGYINMLETRGLLQQPCSTAQALEFALAYLSSKDQRDACAAAHKRLLAENIDVTDFIMQTLERHGIPDNPHESQNHS